MIFSHFIFLTACSQKENKERGISMGKLYWTKDIKEIIDRKISKLANDILNDEYSESATVEMIRQARLLKEFGTELIKDLEHEDKLDDERLAKYRAESKEEEKNEHS